MPLHDFLLSPTEHVRRVPSGHATALRPTGTPTSSSTVRLQAGPEESAIQVLFVGTGKEEVGIATFCTSKQDDGIAVNIADQVLQVGRIALHRGHNQPDPARQGDSLMLQMVGM